MALGLNETTVRFSGRSCMEGKSRTEARCFSDAVHYRCLRLSYAFVSRASCIWTRFRQCLEYGIRYPSRVPRKYCRACS